MMGNQSLSSSSEIPSAVDSSIPQELQDHQKRQQQAFLHEKVHTMQDKTGIKPTKVIEKTAIYDGKKAKEITEFIGGDEYSGLNWDDGNTIR